MSLSHNLSEQALQALIAAINPYAGGNSRLARSLRARLQPRDSKGRWIRTGVNFAVDFKVNGKVYNANPRSVGPSSREGFIQVYVPKGDPNIPEGFYEVESGKGEVVIAVLDGPSVASSKTSITDKNVIDINSVKRSDAPEGWDFKPTEDGQNRWVTQDGKVEIVENAETGKVDLIEDGEKLSEHDQVALAFAESDRRDVEQSVVDSSKKVVARLRKNIEDAPPAEKEAAKEILDRVLFDDPDYEETLQLNDSNPPNPESMGEGVEISAEDLRRMRLSPITGQHLDEDGNFTPERQELHNQIILEALEGTTPVEEPVQNMNGGGPASGKGTMTRGANKRLTNYDENSVLVDPDEVKNKFPEVQAAIERIRNGTATEQDFNWAGLSHEESSHVAKRIHLAGLERHHNIIYDGTGDGGVKSVREKVKLARDNGYKTVNANYLYLEPDEGMSRAKEREKENFRRVPETVLKNTYNTISTIFPELLKDNIFDTVRLFDNNQERGVAAKLILEQKDGETEVIDQDSYNRFLRAKASDDKQPPEKPVAELPEEGALPEDFRPKISADEVTPGTAVIDTDFDVQKIGTFVDVNDPLVPSQLFHVTTNREGVSNSQRLLTTTTDGKGFGGADRNVVSFSGTKERALQMHADLEDYVRLRQAQSNTEIFDAVNDFSAKYDIPKQRKDAVLKSLTQEKDLADGPTRHNAMTQLFNERETATGIPNPVILDNDSWETMSPDNIALLSVPKDRVESTGAAVSYIQSGASPEEFRVHGSVPVKSCTNPSPRTFAVGDPSDPCEDDFEDIDSLTDPDENDVTVAPLESLTEPQLKTEMFELQERIQALESRAGDESVDKEIQRTTERYAELETELGKRQNNKQVDNKATETVESVTTRINSIDAQISRRMGRGQGYKDLEERQQKLIAKREALQKGEQVDDREAGQGTDAGAEGTVPRGVAGAPSRSARVERRGDSLRDVSGNVVATRIAEPTNAEALREEGVRVVELFEVDKDQAEFFRDSFELARDSSTYGSSVTLHDLDYYQQDDVRMFLTQDGLGGIVLNGDEIVTGFMHPEASDRGQGAIVSMVSNMVDLGGRRLDAYDTVLPGFYAEAGFRPVARLRWDDQFAPDDWDYDLYDRWNGGRPDIVFMTFDPDRFGSEYDQSEGQYVDSYETGPVAQQRALEGFDESKWVQIREQRRERARARRMETQQQNDALKQEDGLLVGEVPKNDNDKPKNQALILSPIGQVVEVTSSNGRKMRFIKIGRDTWKRADKPDDHTRYRSHQIRRDKMEYVKTTESDVPSLDLPPRYYNSFRPVPYSIPRGSSDEELKRLRSMYERQADTTDNSISVQRAEATVKFIDRLSARREGRTATPRQNTTDRANASGSRGRRQNAPLLENNDPESGSTEAHVPAKPTPDENGVTDNPELLANIFDQPTLTSVYLQALTTGRDSTMMTFRTEAEEGVPYTGTQASVPIDALRDALQLQGVDTNRLVENARIIRENRASVRDRNPVTSSDIQEFTDSQKLMENLWGSLRELEENLRVAYITEQVDSPRITSLSQRVEALRARIARLEERGFRLTVPPEATLVEVFSWDNNTEPDIYRPELIMDALKARYPDAKLNDDGELIVGEAEHTVGDDRFRYEAVITRTDDEMFYVYIRETNLSDENPATRSRSLRFDVMRHSARAINNQAAKARDKIFNTASGSNIHSWFNDRRRVSEGRAPKFDIPDEQGMPHHVRDQVLTREALRKIEEATSEEGITEEMIGVLYNYIRSFGNDTGVMQALYSTFNLDVPTLNRFVDAVNQHIYERDGLNSFSLWESDNGTPLAEGDLVTYTGNERQRGYESLSGKRFIVRIRGLEHRSDGYSYTDYLQVQAVDENNNPLPGTDGNFRWVSSHNLRLDRTSGNTDGSERTGVGAISMPLPVLTTRAGNRYAGQGRLNEVAPYVSEYDRDTLASPTVDIDGVQYPVQASRQSLLGPDLANDTARPREVQQGDFLMHFDPETSSRRLVEVVNTETLENGNIRLTTVEPVNRTSAKVSQTEFGPDELSLDIYRYDPNFTPDEETLTTAHVGRIADAVRGVNLDELSREARSTIARLLNYDLDSKDLTINEYREALAELLNSRTDEGLIGQVSVADARRALDVAMNRGLPTQDARNNIQAVYTVAAQRAAQIGANTGRATTPAGRVPVASTTPSTTSIDPNSIQRGPFSDEDGVVAGLTKEKFVELITGVGSPLSESERQEELKRIILSSVGGKQYGSVLTLSDFTFNFSGRRFSWSAKAVDPNKTDPSGSGGPLKVARVSRSYYMTSLGGAEVLDVHHNHVFIDIPEYKRDGFATEFYQVSDNFYNSLVDINTIQTVQDGSYAWGAANFTWNPDYGRSGISEIRSRLLAEANKYETSNPVVAKKLQDLAKRLNKRNMLAEDYPDPIDIAGLLDPDDAERREEHSRANNGDMKGYKTLGRRMLQGTNWYGIRYINSDLDPRPENRKAKKTLREQQKEKAKKDAEEFEKGEKAKKEAEERQKSQSGPPQGRTITSLSDVTNAVPGDVINVTEPGYEAVYVRQEDGTWDAIFYGSDSYSFRSAYDDDDLDIVDGFSGDIMSAQIFTTPEAQEYFSQYAAGTLKVDNPTRETVEKALRDGDLFTMEAIYRGNLTNNGKFGRDNFTLKVNTSRMESRGTDYDVYEVGGDILNENGQRVGPFRREIRMKPDGTLEMYHGIVKIEDDRYKRSGFGKDFTQQSEALYRQMGVDSIKLQTAWEGSYFWAMQDYEWDLEYAGGSKYDILSGVPAALQNALDRTRLLVPPRPKDVAALQDIIDRMAGLEIDDPNFPSPREIAMLKSEDPSENDDGNGGSGGWMQTILKNTGWHGRKEFKAEDPPSGSSTAGDDGSGTIALEQTSYQADTPSPLSEEQEDALQWYTDGGFDATNRALRQGETVSPEDKKKIDELLGLIRSSKTTGPLSVYRGRPSANAERASELLNLSPGDEFTDSGVVSTSLDPERAKFYANMDITDTQARAVVKINVPEGSNAYLVPDEFATYNSDKEVLLPPGSTFRVTNVSSKDGIRYIEADLVPPKGGEGGEDSVGGGSSDGPPLSVKDFEDVIPFLSSRESAILATYPDGDLPPRAIAMLELKRKVLTQSWEVLRDVGNKNDISFATLEDGTEVVIGQYPGRLITNDPEALKDYQLETVATELLVSRFFESLGIDDVVAVELEIDGTPTLVRTSFPSDSNLFPLDSSLIDYENVREIGLFDFLHGNVDRNATNMLSQGTRMLPIDHTAEFMMGRWVDPRWRANQRPDTDDTTLEKVINEDSRLDRTRFDSDYPREVIYIEPSNFIRLFVASNTPSSKWDSTWGERDRYKNLFSREELESVNQKLIDLRAMYEAMGFLDYYNDTILKRMNVLLGVSR